MAKTPSKKPSHEKKSGAAKAEKPAKPVSKSPSSPRPENNGNRESREPREPRESAPTDRPAEPQVPVVAETRAAAPAGYSSPSMESVTTDGKPRKNQAGLGSRDLEHFRDLLLAKRREIVGDMSAMEREALRSSGGSNLSTLPIHMADMGTDNYEQEFTLGLVEKERNLLREINHALAKIQNGAYGICEGTGKPISKVRLEAQPWARFSIEHAQRMEKGMGRG